MEKNEIYEEIIAEISDKLSEKIIGVENNLAKRATVIDKDIKEIVQEIGLLTTQKVLEDTCDKIVFKKKAEGMTIHKNPQIQFNVIFGTIELKSPYLWPGEKPSKPLTDEMNITHLGRSVTVKRALSDFGIDDSFSKAAKKFKEHYNFEMGISTADRTTKEIAQEASIYIDCKLSSVSSKTDRDDLPFIEKMLIEMDGCEIRTALMKEIENSDGRTPVYGNLQKEKTVKWRDVRLGFARPLDELEKVFVGKMDCYPKVVNQLHSAVELIGMTSETEVIGIADGGIGLSEELKRQFPNMQFILDKSHLRDHFYDTAEKMGMPKEERSKWAEPQINKISNGVADLIIEELVIENDLNPCDRLKRLLGYLNRFEDAINYGDFREKGYPIGSGEIESAHKSVPQKRLKIPGATWHPDSIDPMLALRILRADDWWEDFWCQRTKERLAA